MCVSTRRRLKAGGSQDWLPHIAARRKLKRGSRVHEEIAPSRSRLVMGGEIFAACEQTNAR